MKRVVRQAATFIGLVLLVGLFRLPFGNYANEVVAMIQEQGEAAGIPIEVGTADMQFPFKLNLAGIRFDVPARAFSVPVLIDSIQVSPKLLPLLLLRSSLAATADLYSGSIVTDVQYSLWGKAGTVAVRAENLALGRHPSLHGFGVQGSVDLTAEAAFNQPTGVPRTIAIPESTVMLTMDDGSYQGGHRIGGLLLLPAAEDIRIRLKAKSSGQEIEIKEFELLSSLGAVRGSGTAVLSNELQPKELDIGMTIQLSAGGAKAFAAYLALAAQMPIEAPPRNWQIRLSQDAGQPMPQTVVKPL